MKKTLTSITLILLGITTGSAVSAQEVTKKNGYTLTFESNYSALDSRLKKRLINTFFIVYPKLAATYNSNTDKFVRFVVDTAYKGVAETGGGHVVFSAGYLQMHPEDIDVVTHEVMHIVQDYGNSKGPGWLTEGIADYARYKFGVDNGGGNWSLPDLQPTDRYTDSYRTAARFLVWIEKQQPGTVKQLDAALRMHTYTNEIWTALTGKDTDALWADYLKNPSL